MPVRKNSSSRQQFHRAARHRTNQARAPTPIPRTPEPPDAIPHRASCSRGLPPALAHAQQKISDQRQQRRRNRPSQYQFVIHHRQPAKNEFAQPSRANRRRNRGNSHGQHGSHANSRQHRRK